MSRFGNFIRGIIDKERKAGRETTARSLAERCGIGASMMSRFLNTPHPSCNRSTLEKIVNRISDDPAIRSSLLAAYLEDQKVTSVAELVSVIANSPVRMIEASGTYGRPYERLRKSAERNALDAPMSSAIEKIIEGCAKSARFRRCVRDLAEIAAKDLK